MALRTAMYTASWTVVTLTRSLARASLQTCRSTLTRWAWVPSPPSSAVFMQWTATSVGTASRWLTTSSYTARDVRWLIWSRVYNLVTTRTQRSTRTPTSLWSHSSTATWMGASRKVMLSSSSFFNYRNDRAKELTIVLTQKDMEEQGMKTIPGLQYYCMTPYDASFTGVHILFPKENVENTLGEYIASKGLKQLHTAETEKYAHVTFFFNGGREEPFEGEDRILVNSPKVPTYDMKPEMSAFEVKDKLVEAIKTNKYDWIVVNFANGDMVGHTGVYTAIEAAVKAIDQCVNEVVETAKSMDYETIIIADHGNADNALNSDGTPNTAHSLNAVPFIYVTENKNAKVQNGVLADVAPSILHIMGLEQPKEMTGKCLIND